MAANMSQSRSAEPTSRVGAHPGRVPVIEPSPARQVTVVVGLILMPLGAIILASAALLQASSWTGAALVAGGASALAAGIGLVAVPVHAVHLRSHQEGRAPRATHPSGRPGQFSDVAVPGGPPAPPPPGSECPAVIRMK